MPIEFGCPCGKTLRVRDELAGERVKCPVCGEIRNVPLDSISAFVDESDEDNVVSEIKSPTASRSKRQSSNDKKRDAGRLAGTQDEQTGSPRDSSVASKNTKSNTKKSQAVETSQPETSDWGMSISGRPVDVLFRFLVPSMFGQTVLRINGPRLLEETQRAGAFRRSEYRLDQITGAEIRVTRNRALLICGLMTLPFGIGLIPLVAYLFIRYRLLFVYVSSSNVIAVSIHALEEEAYAFVDTLLDCAAETNR